VDTNLLSLALEKFNTAAAQRKRDLHIVLARHKLVRRRQEILNDPESSDLAYFLALSLIDGLSCRIRGAEPSYRRKPVSSRAKRKHANIKSGFRLSPE
jgi:hypothetical protein